MRDSPELHWSTQAGTSSSVRDPYPARGLIFHRRPLSGLPPHFRRERRIKRWGIAAGTATGAALGTKSNAKAERKCQNFALVTTLFSGIVTTGQVVLAGEVKTKAYVDLQLIAREVIKKIGYTKGEYMFESNSCGVLSAIHEHGENPMQEAWTSHTLLSS